MKKAITILLAVLLGGAVLLAGGCAARGGTLNALVEQSDMSYLNRMGGPVRTGLTTRDAAVRQSAEFMDFAASEADWDEITYSIALHNQASEEAPAADPVDSTEGRLLIRDVNASVETRHFEEYLAALKARTAQVGGHVQNIETQDFGGYFSSGTRRAHLVLRIPATELDAFTDALGENAHVISERLFVRDVTMQHNDMQAELEALFVERDALLRLMDTAGELGDLLAVQNNLTRVRHQINRLEGEVRLLENQVALSTVSLDIWEVERLTPVEQGFWARTWQGFLDSMEALGNWIAAIFAGLVWLLPWLVFFGLIALVVFLVVRKKIKQRKQRRLGNSE